jgi:acetyl-CoA synthetase
LSRVSSKPAWPHEEEASVARYREVRKALETPQPTDFNIPRATCDAWADDPGPVAMIVPDRDGLRTYTFADFADTSARLANGLRDLGIARGDRVAVCLPQSPECAAAHLAIQRVGAIAVCVSPMHGSDALTHRLEDSGASAAFVDWETHEWVADGFSLDVAWIFSGDSTPSSLRSFDDLVRDGAALCETVETGSDDPAILIYTSGTTGLPKGALHAQRVVWAHEDPISLVHNFFPQDGDVLWSPADWAWSGGLIDCLFAAWAAGRPIVAWRTRGFDPEATIEMIDRCGVTNTFLPPTALRLLKDSGVVEDGRRTPLRSIMTGGERCGEDLIEWCRDTLGLTPNEVYGQTEVSCIVGNSGTVLPVRPGSIGMEYPRASVAVLDDDGQEARRGEVGELAVHISTPAMFLGYWVKDSGAAGVDGDYHRTGDLGRQDDEGYFWHEGRRDDLILSAGYRIGPGEIEECLLTHPSVVGAAVIGEPDPLRGEIVSAVLELKPGAQAGAELESALRLLIRNRLAPYEVPRRFRFVDALPRTETGKLSRARLRRQFSDADPGASP